MPIHKLKCKMAKCANSNEQKIQVDLIANQLPRKITVLR